MKPYEIWLLKAHRDLESARKLIEGDTPIPDTAIYHTQQCAEKSLKAYLSYKQQPIQRTHDIELLVEFCSEFDKKFKQLIEDAKTLTPYSTAFRYPDIVLEPDRDEVLLAIQKAGEIIDFVKSKIKDSV